MENVNLFREGGAENSKRAVAAEHGRFMAPARLLRLPRATPGPPGREDLVQRERQGAARPGSGAVSDGLPDAGASTGYNSAYITLYI
jgi:hypothetical protein